MNQAVKALISVVIAVYFLGPAWGEQQAVTNPPEPVYGKIRFDLEKDLVLGSETDPDYLFYQVWDIKADEEGNMFVLDPNACRVREYDKRGRHLQSIGRQGEGPGEFSRPVTMYLDEAGRIYVLEMRKVHVFTPEGDFIKTVLSPSFMADCVPTGNGTLVMMGHMPGETGVSWGIRQVDDTGAVLKTVAEFPGNPFGQGGVVIHHDYTPELRISPWRDGGFVYGFTTEYKLHCCDASGTEVLVFGKDEPRHAVSRSEKNKILDEFTAKLSRAGETWSRGELERMANMPDHRPFFKGLKVDDAGRVYVQRLPSVMEQPEGVEFDVFSGRGRLLYSLTLPFVPVTVRSGFCYISESSEETGAVTVVRYRIRNWDSLKQK